MTVQATACSSIYFSPKFLVREYYMNYYRIGIMSVTLSLSHIIEDMLK